eukprot:12880470-Prorocentrum_lima.AAC.1
MEPTIVMALYNFVLPSMPATCTNWHTHSKPTRRERPMGRATMGGRVLHITIGGLDWHPSISCAAFDTIALCLVLLETTRTLWGRSPTAS